MRNSAFIISILLLASCAAEPIPPHIQRKADATPAQDLQQHFFAERSACRGERDAALTACREKLRREYYARELMREEDRS